MTDETKKTELKLVSGDGEAVSVPKPEGEFSLDRFKSKRGAALANVETLLTALPHYTISQAKDFVRLHPDEEKYWSAELCFVNVPIKGQQRDTLHLIEEELAMRFLPSARVLRFRLALASKPNDVFFLGAILSLIIVRRTYATPPSCCAQCCKVTLDSHVSMFPACCTGRITALRRSR